jgi:YbbR domain-containing protein
MAFQFTKRRGGDARQMAGRWLHDLIFEDWGLLLLSAAITLGLWYAVTAQRTPSTARHRDVPLDFRLPENVEVSNDPVKAVDVRLEGSQAKLDEINARNLVARVDATQLKAGDRVVRLSDKNVSMELPEGVRIVDISPRSVALRLETVVEADVPVEARFEGEPPEGFERRGVQVEPQTVRVRGPESHVRQIEKVYTETISLEGRRESWTLLQAAVDIPDQKVVPLEAAVAVRVEIAEQSTEKRFTNVGVRSAAGGQAAPQTAAVTLRGPRSVVESLKPDDLKIVVEVGEDGGLVPRLAVPPTAAGRVELVSTTPANFTINR